eukprot:s241_g29.t1
MLTQLEPETLLRPLDFRIEVALDAQLVAVDSLDLGDVAGSEALLWRGGLVRTDFGSIDESKVSTRHVCEIALSQVASRPCFGSWKRHLDSTGGRCWSALDSKQWGVAPQHLSSRSNMATFLRSRAQIAPGPAASPRASLLSPTASPNRRLSEGAQVKDVGLTREAYSKARNMLLAKRASREEASEDEGHEDAGFKRVGKALVTGMSQALWNRRGSNKNQGLEKEKILNRISELDLDEQVSEMLGEMYQGMIELLIDNYEPLEGALGSLLDEAVTGRQDLEPYIDNLRDAVTGIVLSPGDGGGSPRFSSSAGMAFGSSHSSSHSTGGRAAGVNSASASVFGANHDGEASHHFKKTVRNMFMMNSIGLCGPRFHTERRAEQRKHHQPGGHGEDAEGLEEVGLHSTNLGQSQALQSADPDAKVETEAMEGTNVGQPQDLGDGHQVPAGNMQVTFQSLSTSSRSSSGSGQRPNTVAVDEESVSGLSEDVSSRSPSSRKSFAQSYGMQPSSPSSGSGFTSPSNSMSIRSPMSSKARSDATQSLNPFGPTNLHLQLPG